VMILLHLYKIILNFMNHFEDMRGMKISEIGRQAEHPQTDFWEKFDEMTSPLAEEMKKFNDDEWESADWLFNIQNIPLKAIDYVEKENIPKVIGKMKELATKNKSSAEHKKLMEEIENLMQ